MLLALEEYHPFFRSLIKAGRVVDEENALRMLEDMVTLSPIATARTEADPWTSYRELISDELHTIRSELSKISNEAERLFGAGAAAALEAGLSNFKKMEMYRGRLICALGCRSAEINLR